MSDTNDEDLAISEIAFNCTPGRIYDFGDERLSRTGKTPAEYQLDVASLFYVQITLEGGDD